MNPYLRTRPEIPNPNFMQNGYGDRFFFLPFLGGALLGGAAVGLSRPRPVFVAGGSPYPQAPYPTPYPYYGNGYSYGNSGYYNYR